MNGQYTYLMEEKHSMHEKLQYNSNLSWDLVHMIEFTSKDSESVDYSNLIQIDTVNLVYKIMSIFKMGKNLDYLVKQINIMFDQLTLLTSVLENDS